MIDQGKSDKTASLMTEKTDEQILLDLRAAVLSLAAYVNDMAKIGVRTERDRLQMAWEIKCWRNVINKLIRRLERAH